MAHIGELRILVPVDVSGTEPPPLDVIDYLGAVEVVLLGYFPVPDQAEPALLRDQYGPKATDRLDTVADEHGNPAEVLVFTHDHEATIDRIADEYDCDAVLTAGRSTAVDRVLVPLRGDVNLDRILAVVADLLLAGNETATLFHSVAEDADPTQGELLLMGAVDRLVEYGVDRDRLDWRLSEGGDPQTDIVELGAAYDLVVLGETDPSLRERIIGDVLSAIVDALDVPALIVRDVE
ncbi:universal stress protein [Haloferax larsenii]|uniref:Universal stress protein family protein n=1 Tax=Haloferax larsenii TaxID=302484 RepID=A0A1H7T5L2_HALLR|nr:universal stress protein [Haloferax larsenii]SEL80180.1 Universal stress protein family protein [Haloferax larsenii]